MRRRLLLGPEGPWRDDLWFADLLPPPAGAGDEGEADRPPRPALTGPLPVNTCSEDSLTLLPGIGPTLAARLAASRDRDGPFRDAEDLQRVKGVGPVLASRLAPLVVFGPDSAGALPAAGKSP